MKNLFKLIGVAALVLATVFVGQSVFGNGALNYFATTNSIDGSVASITSYPTNGFATNAISFNYTNGTTITTNSYYPGLATGHQVSIYNQEHALFVVQGWLVNTSATANVIGFNLDFAATSGNQPSVGQAVPYLSTNGLTGANIPLQNDWETTPANWLVIPVPALTTNWFNYQTNLVFDTANIMDNSDFIGIYQITNNFGAGSSLVNPAGVAGVNKKLIPTPLIGQ